MTQTADIIAIIPARYGSTRLPGKPLLDIGGKPMILHVCERTAKASQVSRVIVATDHASIIATVQKAGGEAVMTPTDLPSGTDRVAYVSRSLPGDAIIVNVQGDEPLMLPEMIDAAVRPLIADQALAAGTLATPIISDDELKNPAVVKVVMAMDGSALYFSRSPLPFRRDGASRSMAYKHIGLYVYRNEFLQQFASWEPTPLEQTEKLEQLRVLEHGIPMRVTVTDFDSVAVDTAEDLDRVRELFKTELSEPQR